MNTITKKYTLKDLKLGMKVKLSEINEIYDTDIILVDTERIGATDLIGTLVFIGDNAEEYSKWFQQTKPITPLYFDSAELVDGVVYDE